MKQSHNVFCILYILFASNDVQTMDARLQTPPTEDLTKANVLSRTATQLSPSEIAARINPALIASPAESSQPIADSIPAKEQTITTQKSLNFSTPITTTITKYDSTAPANYPPSYKNEFMNAPARVYTIVLKKAFPSASAEDLTTYTNLFLKEKSDALSNSQSSATIPTTDITADPGTSWFYNTPRQALYKTMQNNEATINSQDESPSLSMQDALTEQADSDNLAANQGGVTADQAAQQATTAVFHQAATHVLTQADNAAKSVISGIDAAGDQLDQTVSQASANANQFITELNNPLQQVDSSKSVQETSTTLTDENNKNMQQRANKSDKPTTLKDFNSESPNDTNSAEDNNSIEASSFSDYISSLFINQAKTITTDSIKSFVKTIVSRITTISGYSQKSTAELEAFAVDQVNAATNDINGFLSSKSLDDTTFKQRFNNWVKNLISKLFSSFGKESPVDIQTIQINKKSNNLSNPKITLNYNSATKILKSASITYKGNTYTVQAANIDTSKSPLISITTPLYSKLPNQANIWETIAHNPTVKNTADSLYQSPAGQQLEQAAPGLINTAQAAIRTDTGISDGTINITINTNDNSILTDSQVTQPNSSIMRTTTLYTTNEDESMQQTSTNVQLTGLTSVGDDKLQSPDIYLQFDEKGNLGPIVIKSSSTMINKNLNVTGKAQLDPKTGIYTMVQDLTPQTLLGKIYKSGVDAITSNVHQTINSSVVDSAATSYALNNFKATNPNLANLTDMAVSAIKSANPTDIEKVIVTYNPKTRTVNRSVTTTMSYGPPKTISLTYQLN